MSENPGQRMPWFKFYPADWRADPGLRMCSFAARGLWADLLSLMHEAEPYGELRIAGLAPSIPALARFLGGREKEVSKLIAELEAAKVFSRDESGVIFSRRMKRDHSRSAADKLNGKRGGNAKLTAGASVGVKGGVTAGAVEAHH